MKQTIGLMDISGILHQIRHSKENRPYGHTLMSYMNSFKRNLGLDKIVLIQDYGKSRFRTELYPEYKGHRRNKELTSTEQEALALMSKWNEFLPKFNDVFLACRIPNVEADDLIGMLYWDLINQGHTVIALTADKDFLSSMPTHAIYNWQKDRYADREEDAHGLSRQKFLYFQALQGDSTDNIKGICGEKTALVLVNNFSNFKEMKEFHGDVTDLEGVTSYNKRYVKKAIEDLRTGDGWAKLKLSYKLVKIFTDTTSLSEVEIQTYAQIKEDILAWYPKEFTLTEEIDDFLWEVGEIDFIENLQVGLR